MEQDLFVAGIRILFLFAVPVIIATVLISLLLSVLQTATAIHEPALSYAGRLLAIVLALYLILPSIGSSVSELMLLALR